MLNRREFLQAAALGGTAIGLVGCGSAAGNDAATPARDADAAATTEPVAVRTAALKGPTAMGLSWKSGVAAEVIGLPASSIGIHLYDAKVYLDVPGLLAWTVVIVALSVGLEALLGRLLDWAQTRWEARP